MTLTCQLRIALKQKTLLADGAMGSLLIDRGFSPYSCLVELNTTKPTIIQKIHQEYLNAGADIIYTHTFAANFYQLKRFELEDKLVEINQRAVHNAQQAVEDKCYLAGNIGPTGLAEDELNPNVLKKITAHYDEQAKILIGEGAHMLALETFTNFTELKAVLAGCLKAIATDIPILVSVSPQKNGNLADKTQLKTWLSYLNEQPIHVIGINCFDGPQSLPPLLDEMIPHVKRPLAIKINAGIPIQKDNKWIYPVDSNEFCLLMKNMSKNPLAIIGGCCGTTPEHIKKLAQTLEF